MRSPLGRLLKSTSIRLREEFLEGVVRRRFHLRLTLEGWCMVVIMLLIGLAALNTAAPLLYLMFSMMCAFFIISAILAANTMRGLTVRRVVPSAWLAGLPMRGELRVRNNKPRFSSFSLRVTDVAGSGPGMKFGPTEAPTRIGVLELIRRIPVLAFTTQTAPTQGAAFFEEVPPRGRESVQEYQCVFPRRGLYRMERIDVATRFPFGLIERRIERLDPAEILILPQSIPLGELAQRLRSELGEEETGRRGVGTGIYGFREYTPEFSARDIHWKVSARRGTLVVREYEAEERRRAAVVFDNQLPAERHHEVAQLFEEAIVLATSVVEWLCTNGFEVELRTASGVAGYGTGPTHLVRCRRALAMLDLREPSPAGDQLLAPADPSVVRVPIAWKDTVATGRGIVPIPLDPYRAAIRDSFARTQQSLEGSR